MQNAKSVSVYSRAKYQLKSANPLTSKILHKEHLYSSDIHTVLALFVLASEARKTTL